MPVTSDEARNAADLDQLFVRMEEQKENNDIKFLVLKLTRAAGRDLDNKLWQVLSHSHCKITDLLVTEEEPDAFVESSAARAVKKWCKEIPTTSTRSLLLILNEHDTDRTRGAFIDLRCALQAPNNGVRTIAIVSAFSAVGLCNLFLQPVLENPNNEIVNISLERMGYFSDKEALALSMGLASKHCNVSAFKMHDSNMTSIGSLSVLEGLNKLRGLEEFAWTNNSPNWTECDGHLFVTLAGLLVRPGNTLRSLGLSTAGWQHDPSAILAKALVNENCKVYKFSCDFHGASGAVMTAIAGALTSSICDCYSLARCLQARLKL